MFKLVTFETVDRALRSGLVIDNQIFDVAASLEDESLVSMQQVVDQWVTVWPRLQTFEKAPSADFLIGDVDKIKLKAPLASPSAIYCAAANYRDHMVAMSTKLGLELEPDPHDLDVKPFHFLKPVRASIANPGDHLPWPRHGDQLDWEVELAVVIGRAAREVKVEDALDYVFGYTVANDVSVREHHYIHRTNVAMSSPFKTDLLSAKGFEKSCPIGPYLVPAEFIPDPQNLGLKTWIDGELKQDSHTSQMVFSTAEQIAYLSHRTVLFPGDIILTGTPAGTAAESGTFLKPGQTMKVWVEGIGELQNQIG